MSKYTRFSARANLAVIGLWMVQMRVTPLTLCLVS